MANLILTLSWLTRRCVFPGGEDRGAADESSALQFGKPVYSTRIIIEDLNPVWEETAVMLLSEDEIKSQESVSCTLWDSDKRSAE